MARTAVTRIDAEVAGQGDITVRSLNDVTLQLLTASGQITVFVAGNIHAENVIVTGSAPSDAISLIAQSPQIDSPANILLGTVGVNDTGRITLEASGTIDGLNDLIVNPAGLRAGYLAVKAPVVPNLVLRVAEEIGRAHV